ncbi:MAG TPA: hypothetical protein HPP97_04455 [Desulfuromonadales bacterium]|nr:hypothetical protein [Desulfuromonadales bacterium]
MKQYLQIIQQVVSGFSEEELYLPISETSADSLDLVELRIILERHFNHEIKDEKWFEIANIGQALQYFHNNRGQELKEDSICYEVIHYEDEVEIRMPQMANSALSELWLLKYLGDTHWQLLSVGFGKKSSEFRDSSSDRVYATFLRICFETSPLNNFSENEFLKFESELEGFGKSSFLSKINGFSDKNNITAQIMTTFSVKGKNNNLVSSEGLGESRIVNYKEIPVFANEYRLLKKNLVEVHSSKGWNFEINHDSVYECEYKINPYSDINGVGLLYFASYPIISDFCLSGYQLKSVSSHTVFRDIFYFSNCQASETIIFRVVYYKEENGNFFTTTTLSRKSDNKLLSIIFAVKKLLDS